MELLKWPVSEELIGRKVKCIENYDSDWGYTEGEVYTIGRDNYGDVGPLDEESMVPAVEYERFEFEVLPEDTGTKPLEQLLSKLGTEVVKKATEAASKEVEDLITAIIDPSIIPEGYEFVRIGEAEQGEYYLGYSDNQERTPRTTFAHLRTACAVVVLRKIKPNLITVPETELSLEAAKLLVELCNQSVSLMRLEGSGIDSADELWDKLGGDLDKVLDEN